MCLRHWAETVAADQMGVPGGSSNHPAFGAHIAAVMAFTNSGGGCPSVGGGAASCNPDTERLIAVELDFLDVII